MFEVRITREEFPLGEMFEKCIFFKEGNGVEVKFHLQGIVYDDVELPAIRARLRKEGLKGNQDYKCGTVKDEKKYLAYIAKDKNLIINTTDIKIEEYYGKYEKKEKSKKKIEQIFEGCDPSDSTYTLVTHAIDYYINNDLMINPRFIEGYVLTFKARSDYKFREKLTERITQNLMN